MPRTSKLIVHDLPSGQKLTDYSSAVPLHLSMASATERASATQKTTCIRACLCSSVRRQPYLQEGAAKQPGSAGGPAACT